MTEEIQDFDRDVDKLHELILYIALRSTGDQKFGATKLNKLLFFCDFDAYARLGRPITNAEYQHLENGPAPREMMPRRKKMTDAGEIVISESDYYGHKQDRWIPMADPDLEVFTGAEMALIDEVIERYKHLDAREISRISHRALGWEVTAIGETIRYDTALVGRRELSASEREWVESLESTAQEYLGRTRT